MHERLVRTPKGPQLQNNSVDLRGGHNERNHPIPDGQSGKAMRDSREEDEEDDGELEKTDERDVNCYRRRERNCPVT